MTTRAISHSEYGENPDATFNAIETTTTDLVGFHTEAFLVTGDTGTADSLPIGSVYNTIDFYDLSNVYSSIPQPDGTDEVTDILNDANTGQSLDLSPIFSPYDASAGLDDGSLLRPISFGDDIIQAAPDAQLTYTGINGLPPGNFSIQGTACSVFTVTAPTLRRRPSKPTWTNHPADVRQLLYRDATRH